jgi:hypothetical protein
MGWAEYSSQLLCALLDLITVMTRHTSSTASTDLWCIAITVVDVRFSISTGMTLSLCQPMQRDNNDQTGAHSTAYDVLEWQDQFVTMGVIWFPSSSSECIIGKYELRFVCSVNTWSTDPNCDLIRSTINSAIHITTRVSFNGGALLRCMTTNWTC